MVGSLWLVVAGWLIGVVVGVGGSWLWWFEALGSGG